MKKLLLVFVLVAGCGGFPAVQPKTQTPIADQCNEMEMLIHKCTGFSIGFIQGLVDCKTLDPTTVCTDASSSMFVSLMAAWGVTPRGPVFNSAVMDECIAESEAWQCSDFRGRNHPSVCEYVCTKKPIDMASWGGPGT